MPSTGERQLHLLAAAFEIPKSGKQLKVSFCSLFSKQSPVPNSQIFLYIVGSLSDFNLFGRTTPGRSLLSLALTTITLEKAVV